MVEGEIVRITGHFGDVVLGGYCARVSEGCQVQEYVGEKDRDAAGEFLEGGEERPGGGQVQCFPDCEEQDEEYLGGGLVRDGMG